VLSSLANLHEKYKKITVPNKDLVKRKNRTFQEVNPVKFIKPAIKKAFAISKKKSDSKVKDSLSSIAIIFIGVIL